MTLDNNIFGRVGKGQAGGRYEPSDNRNRLPVVRFVAAGGLDRSSSISQFSGSGKNFEIKGRMIMKARNALRSSVIFLGLGTAALFLPATCHAQAEVAPDFYDMAIPAAGGPTAPPVGLNHAKADARMEKTFKLAYAVECSGKTLPAGEYTVTLPQGDAFGRFMLRHNGRTVELEPRAISRNSIRGESALLVTRTKGHRTLEAIYLQDRHLTVYFSTDSLKLAASNSIRTQRVPIS
jgi:hypothetical protein